MWHSRTLLKPIKMEVQKIGNQIGVVANGSTLLDLALNAQQHTEKMLKILEELDDTQDPEGLIFKEYDRKNNDYKRLVYQLQLVCGIDPNEL